MPRGLIRARWGPNQNEIDDLQIDHVGNSLEIISDEHFEVHEGSHYNIQYSVASLGAATTPADMMTLTWTTPDTTKWLHMEVAATSNSGAQFRFIEGGTGGGASPTGILTAHNSHRNDNNISGIINIESVPAAGSVSYDATLVTGGLSLIDVFIGADGQGNNFSVGADRGAQEWILKQNTQYQISLLDTDTIPGTLQMNWYEHADKHEHS